MLSPEQNGWQIANDIHEYIFGVKYFDSDFIPWDTIQAKIYIKSFDVEQTVSQYIKAITTIVLDRM